MSLAFSRAFSDSKKFGYIINTIKTTKFSQGKLYPINTMRYWRWRNLQLTVVGLFSPIRSQGIFFIFFVFGPLFTKGNLKSH